MAAKNEKTSLKGVLTGLRLLANTEQKPTVESNLGTNMGNTFDDLLYNNLVLLRDEISKEKSLEELTGIHDFLSGLLGKKTDNLVDSSPVDEEEREEEDPSLCEIKQNSCLSVKLRWSFVGVCLRMLCILSEMLKASKLATTVEKLPPADLLSVSDQKVVSTIIQLVVVLGICPNLVAGVGVPLEQRSGFSHLLKTNEQAKCSKCLHKCTMTLVKCLNETTLSMLILSRHFVDILSALLQLAYSTGSPFCNGNSEKTETKAVLNIKEDNQQQNESNNDGDKCFKLTKCGHIEPISQLESEECKKAVKNIVNKMYQPLVVRELLFLQGSIMPGKTPSLKKSKPPHWMRDVCGHLLSKCLVKKNGVQNVLRGILEGAPGSSTEWKICEAIAQLIANCPLQAQSADEYYKYISPQVLGLFSLSNVKLRQQYSRVAVQTIHAMSRRYPELATKYITTPLMRPFLVATAQLDSSTKREIVVDEIEMSHCIESLHKVFVASPDSNQLVIKNIEKIISPMFELFYFTRRGVSHLRTALMELLSTFFKRSKENDSLFMLYVLAFNEQPSANFTKDFSNSEDTTTAAENSSTERLPNIELMKCHFEFQHGEKGGVVLRRKDPSYAGSNTSSSILKNILSCEHEEYETRGLCLVEVLENLRKENVPGRFFLYLLQQVQEIILNPDFGEMEKIRALTIFHVLALMCEKLGPSVLKNTHHMISFIEVTLTRAHHVYMERIREEAGDDGFELETITMALGMLSALLSGAVKIEFSDYVKLQSLASLLQKISNEHVEEEIRELANDLLVVILTQGAVWSEKMKKSENSSNGNVSSAESRHTSMSKDEHPAPAIVESADFDEAFEELCDPHLPVRGHALMKLASLLKAKNGKALEKIDILLKTFQDSLIHDDSYIYLAAIEGLVAAADVKSTEVIPYLAREFVTCQGKEVKNETLKEDIEKGIYARRKEVTKPVREITIPSATTRMKLGEALLRATKRCGDLTPHYFKLLVQAFLVGVKDDESFIRASCLSNLGEVCCLAPQMLPTVIHEIFHCVSVVFKCDKASEVRQAASLVITLSFRGLGKNLIEVLGDVLKDFYQLLKLVESTDSDETTRLHARMALGELDKVMKEQLFPKQDLIKHIHLLP